MLIISRKVTCLITSFLKLIRLNQLWPDFLYLLYTYCIWYIVLKLHILIGLIQFVNYHNYIYHNTTLFIITFFQIFNSIRNMLFDFQLILLNLSNCIIVLYIDIIGWLYNCFESRIEELAKGQMKWYCNYYQNFL